jgi:hypothetical protein
MNTASRMEYWSPRHDPCPQDTVDLLVAAGQEMGSISRRRSLQGKGEMQTYWVTVGCRTASSKRHGLRRGDDGLINK